MARNGRHEFFERANTGALDHGNDMSAQEITFEAVAAAAQRLVDEGRPATVGSLRDTLPAASASTIQRHLATWRTNREQPAEPFDPEMPASIKTAISHWVRQLADDAAGRVRENLVQTEGDLADLLELNEQAEAERNELGQQIARLKAEHEQALAQLTTELRHARGIASDALVGKAKDQLAIEGKDAQLAELRRQLERHVATSAAESDARLAAEMELVGAATARDNLAAEVAELRAQLDASRVRSA